MYVVPRSNILKQQSRVYDEETIGLSIRLACTRIELPPESVYSQVSNKSASC
jgi:hypothetical protein